MAELLLLIVNNPRETAGILLSVGGAIGFFLFMGGFSGGFKHLVKIDMNDEMLKEMRTRAMWGVVLMTFFFLLWQGLNAVLSFLS